MPPSRKRVGDPPQPRPAFPRSTGVMRCGGRPVRRRAAGGRRGARPEPRHRAPAPAGVSTRGARQTRSGRGRQSTVAQQSAVGSTSPARARRWRRFTAGWARLDGSTRTRSSGRRAGFTPSVASGYAAVAALPRALSGYDAQAIAQARSVIQWGRRTNRNCARRDRTGAGRCGRRGGGGDSAACARCAPRTLSCQPAYLPIAEAALLLPLTAPPAPPPGSDLDFECRRSRGRRRGAPAPAVGTSVDRRRADAGVSLRARRGTARAMPRGPPGISCRP